MKLNVPPMESPKIDNSSRWEAVKKYIKWKGIASQHLESYNYFVEKEIKEIVKANSTIYSDTCPNFYIKFIGVHVRKPTMVDEMIEKKLTPQLCRIRSIDYSGNITVDIEYIRGTQRVRKLEIIIGRMPIMVRSKLCTLTDCTEEEIIRMQECIMDPGAYFICNGVERVMLMQEQMSKNRILVERTHKGIVASITSMTHERKSKTTIAYEKDEFYLQHNNLTDKVPLNIVFKAMGSTDYEIVSHLRSYESLLQKTIERPYKLNLNNNLDATNYLGSKVRYTQNLSVEKRTLLFLGDLMIPNIPIYKNDLSPKILTLCLMVKRILQVDEGKIEEDDKDFIGNKRYELAGNLLSLLFEDLFKRYTAELKITVDKMLDKQSRAQLFDAVSVVSTQKNLMTNGLVRAISTGNWTLKRFRMEKVGVTQALSRLSYISALGAVTRVTSQFEKTRKVSGPRSLHTSQWGIVCPCDTPEGESCGLTKNLAVLATVTTESETKDVLKNIFCLGALPLTNLDRAKYIIFLNGTPVAQIDNANRFVCQFRDMRRQGKIKPFVSINVNRLESFVNIASDGGRACRPLFVADRMHDYDEFVASGNFVHFQQLLDNGIAEYIDVNEESDLYIAVERHELTPEHTHMEIHPCVILGVVSSIIPFPHHNQSPRNTYQCAMGKQAIGAVAYNQLNRYDSVLYTLCYPQTPLALGKMAELVGFPKLPGGQNAMIAMMSYSGYDIEDAVVLNRASLDRGFGRCTVYKTYVTEIETWANNTTDVLKNTSCPDERLRNGSIYVDKETPTSSGEKKFSGLKYYGLEDSYVDRIVLAESKGGKAIVKAVLRQTRRPELGDKFSSRHGQKGVCGLIVPTEDMPFTDEGMVPDLIMNPHGIPSRMTIGKLLELVCGKAFLVSGEKDERDATAFQQDRFQYTCDLLSKNGYSYTGKEYMTCGTTGRQLEAYIFYGPVYYQRLKHMVLDKLHARPRGPKTALTRQPTEGRSRNGGLRVGEMEMDCMVSHGASGILLERLMYSSDLYTVFVCEKCGLLAYEHWCTYCKANTVCKVKIPYATKLMLQEIMSMNVIPKIKVF